MKAVVFLCLRKRIYIRITTKLSLSKTMPSRVCAQKLEQENDVHFKKKSSNIYMSCDNIYSQKLMYASLSFPVTIIICMLVCFYETSNEESYTSAVICSIIYPIFHIFVDAKN
mmetsp:Transcript_465/g.779  ORF Transcript_465/g.779 Transcript_465/m.779 type:complete len:113 (-) Transcript_465:701-1039(-)